MSKTITYKGAKFAGTVILSDPLTLDQEAAYEESMGLYREVRERLKTGPVGPAILAKAFLPGILPCVEKWDIPGIPANVTIDTWPLRPRSAVGSLLVWLASEVGKLYADSTDTDTPNA
jgi:hypothetical protein